MTVAQGGSRWKSARALVAGFVIIFALSLAVDQLFHLLGVYPPWGTPMWETGDNVLALSYRLVINTFGCWVAARLAPRKGFRHAMTLGWIGLGLSTLGVLGTLAQPMGPLWYPVLLALSSVPCAWVGGKLAERTAQA